MCYLYQVVWKRLRIDFKRKKPRRRKRFRRKTTAE